MSGKRTSQPTGDSTPDKGMELLLKEEELLERSSADRRTAEIAAGILGPSVDLAQPVRRIRENQISLDRLRLEAEGLSAAQREEIERSIAHLTEDALALEHAAMSGELNERARESVVGFCHDTEELVVGVVEGNDGWLDGIPGGDDLRRHYQDIAKGIVSRHLGSEKL